MYDFKELDKKEFELITRDLLHEEFGINFQTFAKGKDQGIDCLHSIDNNYEIVVQCKHYANSNFSVLFNKLKKEELKKLKRINPKRYILVTSLDLTLSNKQKILDLFEGFIKDTSDILDYNSLNNLLNNYPQVKKNYLKLWIKDSDYLDYLLNRQTHNKSKNKLKNIRKCLNIFVQTPSFIEACKKLAERNYIIITGSQGLGKTTLANVLSWKYINEDYEFIAISDVDEGWNLLEENRKQIFYYDDFLGSTQLETFRRNEDNNLIDFIEAIKNDINKKFILTSRDYILKDAESKSEKFYRANFVTQKIQESDFSLDIKNEIYRKHITESNLPEDFKIELLKEKNIKSIAQHKNYTPRIIEYITNIDNLKAHGVECAICCKQLSKFLLDNPIELWKHPFYEVLDNTKKAFLYTLYTFSGKYVGDSITFEKAVKAALYVMFGENLSGTTFNNALHFLDGFFINIDENYCITFKSPSIIDFLDFECNINNLWETLIDFSFCIEQLDWLYYERIDYEKENELLEKLVIKFTNPEIFTILSDTDFFENLSKIVSLINSIHSTAYDKYICKLLNHERAKNLCINELLELIEYIEPFNMPQDSIVLNFFINYCYLIFNKLEANENISREECELVCAIIVKYIEQIDLSSDIKIKQKIFINMDKLLKFAHKYVANDNPNNLQSIYADILLDCTAKQPSDNNEIKKTQS